MASRIISRRDWPSLFEGSDWGSWQPPRQEEAEEYYIEALLWWLGRNANISASVVARPDREIRDSPQPDFECTTNGTTFWVEISRLYYPRDRMKRLGQLEKFVNALSRELGEQLPGRWLLRLPSPRVKIPSGRVDRAVAKIAPILKDGATAEQTATIDTPIPITLETRTNGPGGIMVSYSSGEPYRSEEATTGLKTALERKLPRASRQLRRYGLSSSCVLMVTDHRTVASNHVPDAFHRLEGSLYRDLAAVFWLDTSLPHTLRPLHASRGLFQL